MSEGGPEAGSAEAGSAGSAAAGLALAAYFFAYIPMLLGIVALASGVKQAIVNTGSTLPAGPCVALGCGVGLFLAGSAAFRHALRCWPRGDDPPGTPRGVGAERYRLAAAGACLAASALGVTVSVAAEMALLTVIVAAGLAAEGRAAAGRTGGRGAGSAGWADGLGAGAAGTAAADTVEP